jgi:transcription-repair coupling factor (superfamily II helicase)
MLRLQRLHPGSIVKAATGIVLVPAPKAAPQGGAARGQQGGGQPVRDRALLDWCRRLLDTVIGELTAVAAQAGPSTL